MRAIHTDAAPSPAGHYSQAIEHDGLVYVAGQLPIDPQTGPLADAGLGEQAEQVLRNIDSILTEAGSGLDRVLQMTIYVSDIEEWDAVNEACARVMGDHRPARAVVPVGSLHFGVGLEVQATAALR